MADMEKTSGFHVLAGIVLTLAGACSLPAQAPSPAKESQGLPPRAAPTDYVASAKAGNITIAAEFTGHGIPNAEEALNSEDHVAVELALFGPPDARLTITATDFSLRINGKKEGLPSQPWGVVARNIKDPEWVPAEGLGEKKSKGGISTGGGGGGQQPGEPPPLPPKVPIDLLRNWQQRLRRAALAEGDRALPQAGLLFFQYRGKTDNIRSLELIYEGPAGKATIPLQ
jgi:hypothetical protein